MKIVVAVLLSIAISRASTPSPKEQFEKFKKDFHKKYGCPEEEQVRFLIFEKALEMINATNNEFHKGNSSITLAINRFADLVGTEVPYGLHNGTASPPIKEFNKFKVDFKRKYECPKLEALRFHIFELNFDIIQQHNKLNSSFTLKINNFTDLLPQEVPHGLPKQP